jgi:SAM-dependent methyltransferase
MRALPTPARCRSGRTPSGPRASTGTSPTYPRVHSTYPVTSPPGPVATSDRAGIHAPLARSSSTSLTSGGTWPGRAWPGRAWPGVPGRANAAAVTARMASASVSPSRLISTATPWAAAGPPRNRITVLIAGTALDVSVPLGDRRAFVAERRAASTHRFDTIHSPRYDENWGTVSPSHAAFVARLAGLVRQGGAVLDAACGTGKYWPALLAAGLRITGVDQSAGMLAQAHRKFPEVPARVLALQDLAALPGQFDGLLCVDALEYVAPEDWAVVTAGLARVLRPSAPAYVTVELPAGPLPPPVDPRQLPGEVLEGGGYHYYPPRHLVRAWLEAAGFTVTEEADADSYWHLLLTHGPVARPDSSSSLTRSQPTPVPSTHPRRTGVAR